MCFPALIAMNRTALQMNGCCEPALMGKIILTCQVLIDGWISVQPAILFLNITRRGTLLPTVTKVGCAISMETYFSVSPCIEEF